MSKVHTYSKHGVWRVCKGRRCALCVPVSILCGKSIGRGHNGVGRCVLLKGHDGKHWHAGGPA